MKSLSRPLLFVILGSFAAAHDPGDGHDHGVEAMERHALELIRAVEARSPVLPQEYRHAFDDPRRRTIDYFPLAAREDQRGLRLGLMRMEQRRATHRLLREVLGEAGYLRAQAVRSLEGHLRETVLSTSLVRVPDAYTVQLFGTPGEGEPWAFKFEGHHLSVNATVVDGQFRGTPLFLGVNPAEVRLGPDAGLRLLAPQEDLARALLATFDAEQRAEAVVAEYDPAQQIPLGALADPARATGLSAADMSADQRALLVRLVASYAGNLRASYAEQELARLNAAGVESLHFLWRGGTRPGEPFSYIVHGPTVVLQLDAVVDVPGEPANHLHALWRDPERDFGADLLARHHQEEHR